MPLALTPEQLIELDNKILDGQIMNGMKLLRTHLGIGNKTAIDVYYERYKELRLTRPTEFIETDKEYWKGFYS